MALIMQGMTTTDKNEKLEILNMITDTDAGTGYLHEGFHVTVPHISARLKRCYILNIIIEISRRKIHDIFTVIAYGNTHLTEYIGFKFYVFINMHLFGSLFSA